LTHGLSFSPSIVFGKASIGWRGLHFYPILDGALYVRRQANSAIRDSFFAEIQKEVIRETETCRVEWPSIGVAHAILTFLFGHCRRGLILAVLAMMRVMPFSVSETCCAS
jgi:hypothetical protein